jgi:hypothetical protein
MHDHTTFCIVHRAELLYLKLLRFLQPRRSAASTACQIAGVKPALQLLSGLTGKVSKIQTHHVQTVTTHLKK